MIWLDNGDTMTSFWRNYIGHIVYCFLHDRLIVVEVSKVFEQSYV